MNTEEVKSLIKRLVSEANVIAPSIINFDKDRKYGKVTDEEQSRLHVTGRCL